MDHATLQWVQGDIEETLTQARSALQKFSQDFHSSHYVQSCADALHTVHGVLEMLEYYGACLLLEEMESLCRMLQRVESDDVKEEMCELLLRSILQLREYLNYLRAGHQDTPTIFMPLLNDLRCVRGEPLLSENALFAPDLNVDLPIPDKTHDLDEDQVCEVARRLRAHYQKGLLTWYQGTLDEAGLTLMQAVVARCEKLCGGTPSVRLWWIAAGVIEALRDGGLEASVSVRGLLGRLDQQLKTLSTDGSAALARTASADLVKNLLYYLTRSTSTNARVTSVRAAYRLDELFVGGDALERAERILCGRDPNSLKVITAGIKEELASVKTALDSHIRQGGSEATDLAPLADRLRGVADSLGLLNLGRSRKLVASHVEQLRGFAESPGALTDSLLMGIVRDLLRVDATLDGVAEQGLVAGEQRARESVTVGPDDTELDSIEYRRLMTAVIGEANTELAAIKHIIGAYLREPRDAGLLDEISRHVSVIEGSLRMLSLERAADLLRDWGRCASSLLSGSEFAPRPETLDALADALVGLEYYLESVVGLQANDPALLEFTEDCMRSLARSVDQARDDMAASHSEPAPPSAGEQVAETEVDDDQEPASAEDLITRMDERVCAGVSGGAAQPADAEASVASGLADVTRDGAVVASQSSAVGNGRLALDQGERVQVSSVFLDSLSGYAGELTISQLRLSQQVGSFKYNLEEMDETIARLRDQLQRLEIETEAQVQHGKDEAIDSESKQEFDALEPDRFSKARQLSGSLLESVSDLRSIREILGGIARESDDILAEQARVSKDLHQGLMRTRLLPFSEQVQRFRRLIRRTMTELDKRVELEVEGQDIRLDRGILERITPSLEHLLRNAVEHGIESPERREQLGKGKIGALKIAVSRSGPEVVINISDDGNGLDQNAIYQIAVQKNMLVAAAKLSDAELFQLILEPGFSTRQELTRFSGGGAGLDVVNADIKQIGGTLDIASRPGEGCTFTIRLPFTLALNQALLVMVNDENFALPISNIAGIVRVSGESLGRLETEQAPWLEFAGSRYQFVHLGALLEFGEPTSEQRHQPCPVVLVHAGEHRVAFLVENLTGYHEIVVKPLGPQLSGIQWLSGATVLGNGRVAMILDVPALMRRAASLHGVARHPGTFGEPAVSADDAAAVMPGKPYRESELLENISSLPGRT